MEKIVRGNVVSLVEHRTFEGEVVSDKMDKTIVVKVQRMFKHPVFGKTIERYKCYKVHDEQNEASVGDWVKILESRPISKTKHMVLNSIIRKARTHAS